MHLKCYLYPQGLCQSYVVDWLASHAGPWIWKPTDERPGVLSGDVTFSPRHDRKRALHFDLTFETESSYHTQVVATCTPPDSTPERLLFEDFLTELITPPSHRFTGAGQIWETDWIIRRFDETLPPTLTYELLPGSWSWSYALWVAKFNYENVSIATLALVIQDIKETYLAGWWSLYRAPDVPDEQYERFEQTITQWLDRLAPLL